jgi:hypothetical protein
VLEDERMKCSSQSRVRRSVTPFKSGPTLMPFPNVWQAVHRFRKMVLAPAASAAAKTGMGMHADTVKIATHAASSNDLQDFGLMCFIPLCVLPRERYTGLAQRCLNGARAPTQRQLCEPELGDHFSQANTARASSGVDSRTNLGGPFHLLLLCAPQARDDLPPTTDFLQRLHKNRLLSSNTLK